MLRIIRLLLSSPQPQFCSHTTRFTNDTPLHLSCSADDRHAGTLSELFGTTTLSITQTSNSTLRVAVQSAFFPSLHTTPLHCDYSACSVLSGIQCSSYMSGYTSCLQCQHASCTTSVNEALVLQSADALSILPPTSSRQPPFYRHKEYLHPFTYLYHGDDAYSVDTPTVFGCKDDGHCAWIHVSPKSHRLME